ncbi:flagellar basal body-associated FliL family protein [Kumtagia ephedrae]|uniref:Flagellar protein FliL n=1 Tax=Kumtagia ephedrae TaxID=2116701 RepID=A0A2P7SLG4_9HYPH|nr:flagellar basal body-associated FliL family protein [Mesorhizobium ephedrae]PSJ63338.1 flagellar basal body-associated protein FliL [Mesorhizobium ephedrae]
MAVIEQSPPPAKGPSLVAQLGALLLMTATAIGGGWFAGDYLGATTTHEETAGAPAAPHADAEGADDKGVPARPVLMPLAPMTTNLAAPSSVWVQMELALVVDAPQPPPEVIEAIHQDLFAYMRTLKMHQVEGASGYQHLKADLEERARIRSGGQVRQILIRTLLFE